MGVDNIAGFGASGVILATGATWRTDGVGASNNFPIALRDDVLTPDNLMDGDDPDPGPFTIYDDDHFYMASVLAEHLARLGRQVTLATPLPMIATWTDLTLEQDRIIARLTELGVRLHPNTTLNQGGSFTSTLTGARADVPPGRLIFVGAGSQRKP